MTTPATDVPLDARLAASRRLAERARAFPHLDPDPPGHAPYADLSPIDRAFARAIDVAATRRWLTLRCAIAHASARAWARIEPGLQGALLAGAAQLLLLDRIPTHAAIDETVEAAKRLSRPRAAGFVNAILRRIADLRGELVDDDGGDVADLLPRGDGRAWRLAEPIFADDPMRRLAERCSMPVALLAHLQDAHGRVAAEQVARHAMIDPPLIVAGLGNGPHPEGVERHAQSGFHVVRGARGLLDELLAAHPGARVQDPAAAAAVAATAELAPSLVIDACAGLGTKTRQLLALHPKASIVASDAAPARLAVLRRTFADEPRVRVVEPARLAPLAGRADLVVLDLPCSNTGVLARRIEARYRFSDASMRSLAALQREIVVANLPLLHPHGHLLHSTCSISPVENDRFVGSIARPNRLRIAAASEMLPVGRPGGPSTEYRDGGHHALLARE